MSVLQAIRAGLLRAITAPRLLIALWLVNFLFAVPVSIMIRQALAGSFGSSRVAQGMREGFDRGWYAEFQSTAGDLEKTFRPTVSGPGPVLDNLQAWWSGDLFADTYLGIVALGLGYAVLWAFLLGGVLDRLARPDEPLTLERFCATCGRYFARFLGLALIAGVVYAAIYRLGRELYGWIEASSRDVTVEKTAFIRVLAASALVVLLLVVARMIFDYIKIAIVVDDQRGFLRSIGQGLRFVYSRPLATLGVTFGFGFLGALLFGFYLLWAPGAEQSTLISIVLAFLGSQVYLISRLAVRLGLLGGEISLYQSLES